MKKVIAGIVLAAAGVLASPSAALDTDIYRCTGTVGAIVVSNLVVPSGATCTLEGTKVTGEARARAASQLFLRDGTEIGGNVEVRDGAKTGADLATIGGDYICEYCVFEDVLYSTVGGSVRIRSESEGSYIIGNEIAGNLRISYSKAGSNAFVLMDNVIGGTLGFEFNQGPTEITGNTITGHLYVVGSKVEGSFCPVGLDCFDSLQLTNNQVGGSVAYLANAGPANISGNSITGYLLCGQNSPAPTGSGNTAAYEAGQCAGL